MSMTEPTLRKPLRLWPAVVAAVLLVLVRLMPIVVDEVMPVAMMGAVDVLVVRNGEEMSAFRLSRARPDSE